ncbi:MAG TPA: HK97-gp10 family putative phage morphogenesis protein [Rhizomicrobium sp.]|jgi:HK97 gp10 family phage protein|nr:HK97-gp10 family putative phage morphogenesis protein [Rhizomicrobium sp.]
MAQPHKWQNRQRLLEKLKAYPPTVGARIKPALASGADRITTMQKSMAPVLLKPEKARTTGALKASIGWAWGSMRRGVLSIGTGGNAASDFKITIYAGDPTAWYVRFPEFGTRSYSKGETRTSMRGARGRLYRATVKKAHAATPAHPYFFPAFRALAPAIKKDVQAAVRAATKEVASK